MAVALTIAGSDSIGGAGIQADIKALASMGIHAASVITCITSQNTQKVKDIYPLPIGQIVSQLEAVLEDAEVEAAKTGMLYSAEIAKVVAEHIETRVIPLVVDPVLVAGVGDSLHKKDLVKALKTELIPLSCCVSPNVYEAEVLSGMRISSLNEARKACRSIAKLGAKSVLLKGGHLKGDFVTDLLYYEGEFVEIKAPRVDLKPHGSGCHLSAYIAGYLTQGIGIKEAVIAARGRTEDALEAHYSIGRGLDIIDSLATLQREAQRYQVLVDLKENVERLESMLTRDWVPEVGINFAYALPHARYLEDVCALEGRIAWTGGKAVHCGCLAYGSSRHIARVVLTAMKRDQSKRSALNLRFSEMNLKKLKEAGLAIGTFDRSKEPKDVKTMEWGTDSAILRMGKVPDIIYDKGGPGKEAMIRVLGNDPWDVLGKVKDAIALR